MKQTIVLLIICIPLLLNAQGDKARPDDTVGRGIKFEQGLTWQQIKAKAKKENKYIFVDCFTTWCGPCKLMDKEVYPNEEVANYMNAHFISVKSQMDKSTKDNDQVKSWYSDAVVIEKEYGIPAYPTYLFFSPKGKLVNRDVGYKNATDFFAIANKAKAPGAVPPYQRYFMLIKEYQQGNKNYDVMPFLVDTAKLLGQRELIETISLDYMNYLEEVNEDELYTKTNITFIASFIKGSKSKLFQLFYPNGQMVDKIMNKTGYSQHVVDRIIQKEDIISFAKLNTGMNWSGPAEIKPEPDWQQLVRNISEKYQGDYPDRLVMATRIQWYSDQKEWANCAQWFTRYVRKYPVVDNDVDVHLFLNSITWEAIFKRSVDKDQIDASIECMEKVLISVAEMRDPPYVYMDTYANVLYKADRKDEAIQWEEKAWKASLDWKESKVFVKGFEETLDKMKKGEPTWPSYIGKND